MGFQTSIVAAVALAALPSFAQLPSIQSTERAIFLSGDVVLEGGAVPTDPVRVQRVCNGSVEGETWTDAKGRFTFKVQSGGGDASNADAAQQPSRDPDLSRPMGNSTYYQNPITTALRDCEVQAILTGFWSDRASVAIKNTLDDTRIGTLILHPISRGQALTVSATTLQAPAKARKAFEKGMAAGRDQKWDDASNELQKAVNFYPQFAVAWFELGAVRERRNDAKGAMEAWQQSIKADTKYVKPYEALAALSERQQNWPELEKYSRTWIGLAPEDFPAAYLYNAFANAQLNKFAEAESAARKGLALDKERKLPRLNYVLGLLLMQKRDYAGAATCLRSYLEMAPNAPDAAAVRQELTRIEALASSSGRP